MLSGIPEWSDTQIILANVMRGEHRYMCMCACAEMLMSLSVCLSHIDSSFLPYFRFRQMWRKFFGVKFWNDFWQEISPRVALLPYPSAASSTHWYQPPVKLTVFYVATKSFLVCKDLLERIPDVLLRLLLSSHQGLVLSRERVRNLKFRDNLAHILFCMLRSFVYFILDEFICINLFI